MNNNQIKNRAAYFNKVVKNMDRKDRGKAIDIDNFEILTDKLVDTQLSEDEYFCGNDLREWIELVENAELHKALKSLSIEEQTLLSYVYYKDKTQSEVAKIYGIARQNIGKKITKALNKIKTFLLKT